VLPRSITTRPDPVASSTEPVGVPADAAPSPARRRPAANPGAHSAEPAQATEPAVEPAASDRAVAAATTDPPPDAAPAEALPVVASDAASPPGIDELRAAWPAIVAALSQHPPVKPLIAACRPVSLEGAVVTLGFPEDQAFLKDALERRRAMLEDGIGRILGRSVNVRCVATNLEHVPAVPLGEAADLISEARRIFADDLVDVGEVS
jgi:hypothetical protein